MNLIILGRQSALALAELESIYGAGAIQPVSDFATLAGSEVDIKRLGGAIKVAKVLQTIPKGLSFTELLPKLESLIPEIVNELPPGKLKLGFSLHGFDDASVQKLNRAALQLKKIVKASGRSARIVPNQNLELSSAQVLHNQLTSRLGCELIVIKQASKTIFAKTSAVQNIEEYAMRDHAGQNVMLLSACCRRNWHRL